MEYKDAIQYAEHEGYAHAAKIMNRHTNYDDALNEAKNYLDPMSGLSETVIQIRTFRDEL